MKKAKKEIVEILVRTMGAGRDGHYFIAEVRNDTQLWANGDTEAEAIGNLIRSRGKELGFKIKRW